jgi:hypothetical protein
MYRFSELDEPQLHNKYDFSVRTILGPTQLLLSGGGGSVSCDKLIIHCYRQYLHSFMVYSLTEHTDSSMYEILHEIRA